NSRVEGRRDGRSGQKGRTSDANRRGDAEEAAALDVQRRAERGDVERDARAERETDAASRTPLRERVSRAAAQLDRTAPSSLDAGVEDAAADSRAHLADEGPRAEVVRRVCARVQRQLAANVACWHRLRL